MPQKEAICIGNLFEKHRDYCGLYPLNKYVEPNAKCIACTKRIKSMKQFRIFIRALWERPPTTVPIFSGGTKIEEELRKIDNTVSLPYWDATLEFEMQNPANTVLFSPVFLGNGYGLVTTGPFANLTGPVYLFRRNIAVNATLFTNERINLIMSRCQTRQIITATTANRNYNLEFAHYGVHRWVGGQMRGLATAAHDPVFFLHHAFVDNIWQRLRNHQLSDCNVKLASDYPHATGQHAANRRMDGLPEYINSHEYRNYWTSFVYTYEPALSCPFYGESPYLTCNTVRRVCVYTERELTPDEGSPVCRSRLNGPESFDKGSFSPVFSFSPAEKAASVSVAKARELGEELDVGPVFNAPPAEPRTQSAWMARIAAQT